MILLWAIVAGLLFGLGRAWIEKHRFKPPALHEPWLVLIAYIPQWLVFQWSVTRTLVPDSLAAVILVVSQTLLLVFAWFNRKTPGFVALGVGLALDLFVISFNNGLMPISPETLNLLYPNAPADSWQLYQRLWGGKDIVLPVDTTSLWWFSDIFVLPSWINYRVAFSLGDIFIAIGAFWLLWVSGGTPMHKNQQ
jgi:hypothetical protein